MTITDAIAIVSLLILAANGAYQGFLRSLVGPLALLSGIGLSYLCYTLTHNFRIGFLIGIFGPIILAWCFNRWLRQHIDASDAPKLSLLSRLAGQMVNMCWGGALILVTVATLSIFPFDRFELENAGRDVHHSRTLKLIRPFLVSKGLLPPEQPAANTCPTCAMKEKDVKALADDKDVLDLMADPRMQKLLNNPNIQKAVSSNNIPGLMSDPVIMELAQDPAFLVKAMKLYSKIQAKNNNP